MQKIINIASLLLAFFSSYGQNEALNKTASSIVAEAKILYKSEMASWLGTDLFLENYRDKERIGGYFSYPDHDTVKNIFFSKEIQPKVIGTICFDSSLTVQSAKVYLNERQMTPTEEDYFVIRSRALLAIKEDSFFNRYEKTNFNIVPLITDGEKKVYVLTGPEEKGVMIFGNDYLLKFDNDNKLTNREKLHNSLLKFEFNKDAVAGYHSHVAGFSDYITPTDLCTLMLYGRYTQLGTYCVISKKYFSVWDCKKKELLLLTPAQAKVYFNERSDEKHTDK